MRLAVHARIGAAALAVGFLGAAAGLLVGSSTAGAASTLKEVLHTGLPYTQIGWATMVLEDAGWTYAPTSNNMTVMLQWMASENYPSTWWAPAYTSTTHTYTGPSRNNPLNCGTGTTPGGLGSYQNLVESAYYVARNLVVGAEQPSLHHTTHGYPAVVNDFAADATPKTTAEAIVASTWAASHYDTGADWMGDGNDPKLPTYTKTQRPTLYTFIDATDWDSPAAIALATAPGVGGYTQELFAVTTAGTVWEKSLESGVWHGWTNLGGHVTGNIQVAHDVNGATLELFAVGTGGQVYDRLLTAGSWSAWAPMDGTTFTSVTWAPGSNGSLQEVFGIQKNGSVSVDWETKAGHWSGWEPEGGGATGFTSVSVAAGSNGSLQELFGIKSGAVSVTWENAAGTWTPWVSAGTQQGLSFTGSITVAAGSNGSLQEIFATSSGNVYVKWENPGGAWSPWAAEGQPKSEGVQWTTIAPGSNGSLQELLAVADGYSWVRWENPGGTWSTWFTVNGGYDITGPMVAGTPTPGVTQYLYVVGARHTVYEDEEIDGGWLGWTN